MEYVPHVGCETPVPDWKSAEWARDVLPEQDPAHPLTPPARRRADEDKGGGIMTTTIRGLEKRTFDAPDEIRIPFEKGRIDVVTLAGLTFYRETLQPGWRWSEHVKPVVGTES